MESPASKERIGDYELIELIGDGAQGRIYKARKASDPPDAEGGPFVAIKIVRGTASIAATDRFRRAAQTLLQLDHPNLVHYYDAFVWHAGEWDEAKCLVMEFLQGETLDRRIARAPHGIEWEETHRIFSQCLDGLVYASGAGITHRDLKPSNIFLTRDGTVKNFDFDIARREGDDEGTVEGWKGTFDYMAPDFAMEPGFRGDELSDLFSLGVCLYQVLTGRLPAESLSGNAHIGYLNRWKDGGSAFRVSYSASPFRVLAHARTLVSSCLHLDRAQRCASLQAMREGLDKVHYRRVEHRGGDTYELREMLGGGGFGEVFRALRQSDGKAVAVKHLFAQGQSDRFLKEARILQRYAHPHIVQYIDFIAVKGAGGESQYFLVMELLDDMPAGGLRTRIKTEGRFDLLEATTVMLHYLDALRFLHENGRPIIHRDIKPTNLYAPRGRPDEAKIFDLGVARDVRGTATAGAVPGTLDYMAPEFATAGVDRGTPQSDIYALGLCFYEMLTGRAAFARLPRDLNTAWLAFQERSQNGRISYDDPVFVQYPALQRIVARALSMEPKERYARAAQMIEELGAFRERVLRAGAGAAQVGGEPVTIVTSGAGATGDAGRLGPRHENVESNTGMTRAVDTGMRQWAESRRPPRTRLLLRIAAGVLVAALLGAGVWWAAQRAARSPRAAEQSAVPPAPTVATQAPAVVAQTPAGAPPSEAPPPARPRLPVFDLPAGLPAPATLAPLLAARATLLEIAGAFPSDAETRGALQRLGDYTRGLPSVFEERVRDRIAANDLDAARAAARQWRALQEPWVQLGGDADAHGAAASRVTQRIEGAVFDAALASLRARVPATLPNDPAALVAAEALAREVRGVLASLPETLDAGERARRTEAASAVDAALAERARALMGALAAAALQAVAAGKGEARELTDLRALPRLTPRLVELGGAAHAEALARIDGAVAARLASERTALEKEIDTAETVRDLVAAAAALDAWRARPLAPAGDVVRAVEERLRVRTVDVATALQTGAAAAYGRQDLAAGDTVRAVLQSLAAQTSPRHGRPDVEKVLRTVDTARAQAEAARDEQVAAQKRAQEEAARLAAEQARAQQERARLAEEQARRQQEQARLAMQAELARKAELERQLEEARRSEGERAGDVAVAAGAGDEEPESDLERAAAAAAAAAMSSMEGRPMTDEERLAAAIAAATGGVVPRANTGAAAFQIVVSPPDAKVYLDGRPVKAGHLAVAADSTLKIRIEREGYVPFEQSFRLGVDEKKVLDVLLRREERRSFFGR